MRVLDSLAKALGGLILLAVLLGLPLFSVGQRAFHVLYDAPTLAEAIETYWVGPESLARLGKAYVHKQVQQTPASDSALVFWRALDALDAAQWRTLTSYVAPRQVVHEVVAQGAHAWMFWWKTPGAPPRVEIALTPWKQAMQANAKPLSSWLLSQFRECTVPETAQWAEATLRNDWALPPLCVPLGAPRQMLNQMFTAAVTDAVHAAPNAVNLLDPRRVSLQEVEAVKSDLWLARRAFNIGWVALAVLWLLGVLLVGRSLRGWLQVAGVTWLVGGASVAAMGLLPDRVTAWTVGQLASQVPAWAQASLQGTVAFYAARILSPLRLWGVGVALLGGVALVGALLLASRSRHEMRLERLS